MKGLKKIRVIGEGVALVFGFLTIPWLPRKCVVWLSQRLGSCAMRLAPRERRIGMANLDLAYGQTISQQEKLNILRESFQTFTLTLFDLFWFSFRANSRIRRWVVFEPSFLDELKAGTCLFVTAHFGNWEIMGKTVAFLGYPLASVAKPLANPLADRILIGMRQTQGQIIIPQEGAMRAMLRNYKKNVSIALLLDQDTSPRDGGVSVKFFDQPVSVSKAGALLASHLKARAVFVFCRSVKGVYHAYVASPTVAFEKGQTDDSFTQLLTSRIEDEIRRHPGQWLWTYKRWKRSFPGYKPSKFHFYAHD